MCTDRGCTTVGLASWVMARTENKDEARRLLTSLHGTRTRSKEGGFRVEVRGNGRVGGGTRRDNKKTMRKEIEEGLGQDTHRRARRGHSVEGLGRATPRTAAPAAAAAPPGAAP